MVQEEAFYLAFALRFVWPRMHEGNTEACGDVFEMMRAECCAVVGVEFSGQSSGQEGRSEGLDERFHGFGQITKLCVRNKPGVIVN